MWIAQRLSGIVDVTGAGLAKAATVGLFIQSIANASMASVQRHGGGYMTEAGALFRGSVQPQLLTCIDALGAGTLPPERVIAHCLTRSSVALCDAGEDAYCHTSVARSMPKDGVQSPPPSSSGAQASAELRARFVDSEIFEASMRPMVEVIEARSGGGFDSDELPYTKENLRALIVDQDDAFLQTLTRAGASLHRAAVDIVERAFRLQPDLIDAARLSGFRSWLDSAYPENADGPLTDHQLNRILADLAAWLNGVHGPQRPLHRTDLRV